MAKSDRLAELSRIAEHGAEIVYAGSGWIAPNRWLSREIIIDFETRGLIERQENRVVITARGKKLIAEVQPKG